MSDEDHKEDAVNYVAGGMRSGKTLLARERELMAEVKKLKATYVPQRNAIELMERLEAVGYGKPGTGNTLFCMVLAACDDIDRMHAIEVDHGLMSAYSLGRKKYLEGERENPYSVMDDKWQSFQNGMDEEEALAALKARATKLDNALRSIAHVDKTPHYGNTGKQADKDRHGQLPKKSGERWKTPREIARHALKDGDDS